jgi:hypothetical protein
MLAMQIEGVTHRIAHTLKAFYGASQSRMWTPIGTAGRYRGTLY